MAPQKKLITNTFKINAHFWGSFSFGSVQKPGVASEKLKMFDGSLLPEVEDYSTKGVFVFSLLKAHFNLVYILGLNRTYSVSCQRVLKES